MHEGYEHALSISTALIYFTAAALGHAPVGSRDAVFRLESIGTTFLYVSAWLGGPAFNHERIGASRKRLYLARRC